MVNDAKILVLSNDKVKMTERDVEMVQGIADGVSRKELAKKYGVSIRTIEGRFSNMEKKVNVDSMGALVAVFFRNGLIK